MRQTPNFEQVVGMPWSSVRRVPCRQRSRKPLPERRVSLDALLQGVDDEAELLLDGLLAHSAVVTHVDDRSSTETCSRFSRRYCRVLQSCVELHDGGPCA